MAKNALLTEGNVFRTLLRFSLPFLLSNILQACYGASDLFMVGRFANSVGVAAVATGGQIMQTITSLSIGLTAGVTVCIGQYYGARRIRDAVHAIKTSAFLFGTLSLLLAAAILLLLDPACRWMQVPEEARETTRRYLAICSTGIPFIVGYNVISAVLRGLGDSRTPLVLITTACVINVSTDLLFVGVLRQGAPGAAVSTVIAQAASLLLAVLYLAAKGCFRRYRRERPRFQLHSIRRILSSGFPIALQEGLVNVSFLIITAVINRMGLVAAAAVGVTEKLIAFSMLPTTAFAAALAAMTAQHHGAGQMNRARHCLDLAVGMSLVFGVLCFGLAQWKAPSLIGLFSTDPAVIASGSWYLRSYSLDCIAVCFVFCMNSFFSGSGHALFPLAHSLAATFLVRIPLSCLLSQSSSLFPVGFAAPVATLFSFLLCEWFLARTYGKGRRRIVAFWNRTGGSLWRRQQGL